MENEIVLTDCCEICGKPYSMTAEEIRECIREKIQYKHVCKDCRTKDKEK